MIPIIGILGYSDSGKTLLVEVLCRELTRRGRRVGTLKHDGHGHVYDRAGSDTWRHRRGGAVASVVFSAGEMALFGAGGGIEAALRLLTSSTPELDLVLLEGFSQGAYPCIILTKGGYPQPPGRVLASLPGLDNETSLGANQLGRLADLIVNEAKRQVAAAAMDS